jgi:hypothetical protein
VTYTSFIPELTSVLFYTQIKNHSLHVYFILNKNACILTFIVCTHHWSIAKSTFNQVLLWNQTGIIGFFEYVVWTWNMSVNWLGIIFWFVLMTEFDHWNIRMIYILFSFMKFWTGNVCQIWESTLCISLAHSLVNILNAQYQFPYWGAIC